MIEQARKIIADRGRSVLKARRGVLEDANAEAIHDLRVATRRLQAALDIFGPYLPDRERRRLDRRARTIRRKLGAQRNACMVLEVLSQISPRLPGYEKRFAAGLKHRLGKTSAAGRRAARRKGLPGLRKRLAALLRALRREGAATRSGPAPAIDPARAVAVLRACREARDGDAEALHRLRIAIKRHRYAMEILAEAGVGGLRPAIREARVLQTHLGDLHDLDLLIDLVHQEAHRPGGESLLRRLLRRRQAERVMSRLSRYRPAIGSGAVGKTAARQAGPRSGGPRPEAGPRAAA
ncbi:MAG: hypothetical protein AUI47_08640 [Acidobacteria bacterium 13_1_40CM_2_68_5]|nr:MAG: hypothetical protein AUI47_08640 [Acidobacteria bacterium 13_1_40CM_2_68_5]